MTSINDRLIAFDADRDQMKRDGNDYVPLAPIPQLKAEINELVPQVIAVIRADEAVSRKQYNGIRPAQIEYEGTVTAAWIFIASARLGVPTHVYLTLEGGLRSFPHHVNTKRWFLGKYRRYSESKPFEEYLVSISNDQDLVQRELSEVLRLLKLMIPSFMEYHRSVRVMAEADALEDQRRAAAAEAAPRLQAARIERARRLQARGGRR